MKKIFISILTTMSLLAASLPVEVSAAEAPAVVDLIHSEGTTLRDGVAATTHYVTNSGTDEAPERQVTTGGYNTSYGAPETAFDGSVETSKNECIVNYAYELYFQVDLGARRDITQIVYTVKSTNDSAVRNDDKQNFMIELSNDADFNDDIADPIDVIIAYVEGDVDSAKNIHTVNLSNIPAYRYIRISPLDNEFMTNRRELCVAELEVYGYTEDEFAASDLAANAVVTAPDNTVITTLNDNSDSTYWTRTSDGLYVTFNLGAISKLSTVTIRPYSVAADIISGKYRKGLSVWASNDPNFVTYDVIYDGTSATAISYNSTREVTVADSAPGYQYVRIIQTGTQTQIGLSEIDITGYNLFDAYAYLDITDDGSTVYARAKHGGENTLILAEYDSDGRCLQTKTALGTETITMTVNAGSTYKAFLWKSLTDRTPVTKAIRLVK